MNNLTLTERILSCETIEANLRVIKENPHLVALQLDRYWAHIEGMRRIGAKGTVKDYEVRYLRLRKQYGE